MSSKQAIFIAASICFILLFAFLFWGGNRELDQAQQDFLQGNYKEAKEKLYLAQGTLSPTEYHLYMAYVLREQQKLDESSKLLRKAQEENPKKTGPLGLEVLLNQLLNAYLAHDYTAIESGLLQASQTKDWENNNWIEFFRALENYMKDNYKAACSIWKKVETRTFLSPWMQKTFGKEFSPFWLAAHIVRCEIEEGDYLDARQVLQKDIQTVSGAQLEDLYFLLGLSYAKEAKNKAPGAAIPFYKQAFSYFEKIPIDNPRFYYEKQQILAQIQQAAMQVIEDKSFQDLTFYINALEQWKAVPQLNALQTRLIEVLYKEIGEKDWSVVDELTEVLNKALPPGNLRRSIGNQYEKLVLEALNTGDLSHIKHYWGGVLMFSANPEAARKRFTDMTAQKIIGLIPGDNAQLASVRSYLDFWKEIEQDHQKRYQFALELIGTANYIWAVEHESNKGLALMEAASQLPYINEQKLLKPLFEKIFNQLYALALNEDRIAQLKDILEAINQFQLTTVPIRDPLQQGNLIEDAQFLFNQKRYAEAEKKARWVYELNPSNPSAIKLLGLLDYLNGNYREALKLFKQVKKKDPDMVEASAVSEILAGDKAEGLKQLKTLEGRRAPLSDVYLRIGYSMLAQGDPQGGLAWFNKAVPKTDEVYAGEEYAAYEMRQWQKALDLYHQLSPPYSKIDALQGIAVESLIEIGKAGVAEQMLNNLLREEQEPGNAEFPPAFLVFKNQLLDQIQRGAIAGRFTLKVKNDPQKALAYLSQIPNPSAMTLLDKAEVLLALGNLNQAMAEMSLAAEKSRGRENADAIRRKTLPLMAAIYAHMGYLPEAAQVYQQYFAIDPENITLRLDYAKVWMGLQRYDLALKELQLLEKNGVLDTDGRLNLITCLVRLNRFDEANQSAKEWMAQNPPPALVYQLKLARLMIISRNSEVFTQILQKIPDFNRRTLDENIGMIRLWINLGDYEKADALSQRIKNELEKNLDGLLALADLNVHLSHIPQAIDYAGKALALDPYNIQAKAILSKEATDPEYLVKKLDGLKPRLEEDPKSISLKMEIASTLIDLAKFPVQQHSSDLTYILTLIDDVLRTTQEIPEAYVMQGQAYFLLDNFPDALKSLQQSVKLDPSNVEAYELLIKVYDHLQDPQQAVNSAMEALKFASNDAKVWLELAEVNEKSGNQLEAINFLLNAIKFKPNDPQAYIELGRIYYEVKNVEGAESMLEKALRLTPDNIEVLKQLYIVLKDPDLILEEKPQTLAEKQKQTLEKLQKLDPKAAEELKKRYSNP